MLFLEPQPPEVSPEFFVVAGLMSLVAGSSSSDNRSGSHFAQDFLIWFYVPYPCRHTHGMEDIGASTGSNIIHTNTISPDLLDTPRI